jgi:hypothetical protein
LSDKKLNPKNIFEVNSLSEYISLIEQEPAGYKFFYRGLSRNYKLLSTLGRYYPDVEEVFWVNNQPAQN